MNGPLEDIARRLDAYRERFPGEDATVAEFERLVAGHADCLERSCLPGHLTASGWVNDGARRRVVLVNHRKLGRWLQPGGHADGDPDLAAVALREVREETGLAGVRLVSGDYLDIDRHWIPARANEPGHWHYDFRFLIEADPAEPFVANHETRGLAWVGLADVAGLNPDESVVRLVAKTGRAAGDA